MVISGKRRNTIEGILWGVALTVYYLFYYALIHMLTWLNSSLSVITDSAMLLPFFFWLMLLIYKRQRYRLQSKQAIPGFSRVARYTGPIVILLLISALIPVTVGFTTLAINESYTSFSQKKWLDAPDKRLLMISDLSNKHGLRGVPKQEVQQPLGPANEGRFDQPNQLVYYIGEGYIDSIWLLLKFDENNKVKEYQIQPD